MKIQTQIEKAQSFYKAMQIEEEREGRKTDKRLLELCESYDRIYKMLVKDCAINGWDLFSFNVSDLYFDVETFENDVQDYKSTFNIL